MAARIAQVRMLTDAQFQQVRCMLQDIASTLFGPAPSGSQQSTTFVQPSLPPVVPGAAALAAGQRPAHRPSPEELKRMAESVGQRYGGGQSAEAQAMLQMMSDVLFGADPAAAGTPSRALPAGVPRPSPRTLEAITQRVIARTGGSANEAAVRQMLAELTQALFGPTVAFQEPSSDNAPSQLCTARSSVRSRSSASQESRYVWPRNQAPSAAAARPEIQQEVHGLMTELCGVLFEAESP
mmetsp:Transcript_33684/g.104958  ORF Transcript_33684/g.104958 Transcript_33684/m.104958 type:complete len:239 (+) Transcript_33684:2-718(+)